MRIAVAGFAHESNTFYSQPTRLGDFGVCEGEAILSHYANTFHEIAGYIAGAEQFGYDIFPILAGAEYVCVMASRFIHLHLFSSTLIVQEIVQGIINNIVYKFGRKP